jgi:hypothetical protein
VATHNEREGSVGDLGRSLRRFHIGILERNHAKGHVLAKRLVDAPMDHHNAFDGVEHAEARFPAAVKTSTEQKQPPLYETTRRRVVVGNCHAWHTNMLMGPLSVTDAHEWRGWARARAPASAASFRSGRLRYSV